MPKYAEGQVIALSFEDYNHPEYIKGEVTLEQAKTAVSEYWGNQKRVTAIVHTYAFWGVGQDEMGEPCQILYDRSEPGRGRFKVTECTCEWVESIKSARN